MSTAIETYRCYRQLNPLFRRPHSNVRKPFGALSLGRRRRDLDDPDATQDSMVPRWSNYDCFRYFSGKLIRMRDECDRLFKNQANRPTCSVQKLMAAVAHLRNKNMAIQINKLGVNGYRITSMHTLFRISRKQCSPGLKEFNFGAVPQEGHAETKVDKHSAAPVSLLAEPPVGEATEGSWDDEQANDASSTTLSTPGTHCIDLRTGMLLELASLKQIELVPFQEEERVGVSMSMKYYGAACFDASTREDALRWRYKGVQETVQPRFLVGGFGQHVFQNLLAARRSPAQFGSTSGQRLADTILIELSLLIDLVLAVQDSELQFSSVPRDYDHNDLPRQEEGWGTCHVS